MRHTNTQNSTNALAGPSGTTPNGFATLQNSVAPGPSGDDQQDDDDLSSLPDEYKEDNDKDSDEDAVVARSTWKGKERMIIHSDDDDDDSDEDVYVERQEEKLKRERQREKEKGLHREQRHRQSHAAHQYQHEKLFGGGSNRESAAKRKSTRRRCRKHSRRNRHRHDLDELGGSSSDEDDLEPSASAIGHPGIIAAPDTTNDVPLPEGIDPKNVEDIFLGLTAVPVPADWSEDDEDEGILFQALDDWHDSDDDMDAGSEASDDSGNGTSDTDMLDEDDALDAAFGLGDSEMPLVLMEDWSGNLVFAQPRISGEGGGGGSNSRSSTSVSREKEKRRSRKGSGTGSTTNGEGPVLLVDEGALEEWDENVFDEGDTYDGDTTDSLPDEDMPSPPNLMSFSGMAVSGVEANNAAAFGVTTVDEAALARDLGVPLADARNLLERARAEEQQQLLGGVSNLSMTGNEEPTSMEPSPIDGLSGDVSVHGLQALFMDTNPGVSTSSTVTTPNTNTEISPHPANAIPTLVTTQSTPPAAHGFPVMGAFLPEHDHPDRVAVIDGTGKVTPSPFMRRGGPRGRARGGSQTGAKGSNVKRQALGASPSTNGRRPRYSSVPAGRGHISDNVRGSPLRLSQRESFDRDDTSSDHEDMAEPISLDDVLDTSALHHLGHETDQDEEIYGSRHLRNLRRWEKVPITTFRRSRNSNAPFTSSTGLFAADGSNPSTTQGFTNTPSSGAILRPTFASPSIASTLAMDPSTGYPVSPILEATNQDGARNGKAIHRTDKRSATRDSKKLKKQDQQQPHKTSRNGGLVRNRTASAGSMPPLRLS